MTEVNKKNKGQVWQMIKFTLFSISAGLIQIGSFALLKAITTLEYWPAYLISLVLSVLWNFTFNRRYTFRSDANVTSSMLLVFAYYIVFTPLSTWWGYELTHNLLWSEAVVLGGTMIINFVSEFLYQRFVVYRNKIDNNDIAKSKKKQTVEK